MSYTPHWHCLRIHKAKTDITLLFLSDSSNFNNGVQPRRDILNERLSPKPNLLPTLSRLRNTQDKQLMKETDFFNIYLLKISVLLFTQNQLTFPLILLAVSLVKLFDAIKKASPTHWEMFSTPFFFTTNRTNEQHITKRFLPALRKSVQKLGGHVIFVTWWVAICAKILWTIFLF